MFQPCNKFIDSKFSNRNVALQYIYCKLNYEKIDVFCVYIITNQELNMTYWFVNL